MKFCNYFSEKDIENMTIYLQKMTCTMFEPKSCYNLKTNDVKEGLNKYYDFFICNDNYKFDERTENMLHITRNTKTNHKENRIG